MQGQNDPMFKSIVEAVSAIVFLSTPHRGTNLAETLNRILQVSFISNPTQFIAELAAGSQTLQKLNEQFRHVAPKLDIVSFYETRPTTMFSKTSLVSTELYVCVCLNAVKSDLFLEDGPRERFFSTRLSRRSFASA